MNLTPEELAAIGSLDRPRTITLASVGQFVIDLAVRIDADGSVLSLDDLATRALANQLREIADMVDPDEPEPFDGEIRYVKGTDQLDEILLSNVDVHIEQMDSDVYWMCFTQHGDKTHKRLVVNICHAEGVKRRAPLNGFVSEADRSIKETR